MQDEYSRLSRNASLGVHGYILVFSLVSRHSFERIGQVNDSLLTTLGDAPDVPRVLVGSMKDLEEQRQVSHQVSGFQTCSLPEPRYRSLTDVESCDTGRSEPSRFMGHSIRRVLQQEW
jgi:GTPase SAR1 family protein